MKSARRSELVAEFHLNVEWESSCQTPTYNFSHARSIIETKFVVEVKEVRGSGEQTDTQNGLKIEVLSDHSLETSTSANSKSPPATLAGILQKLGVIVED